MKITRDIQELWFELYELESFPEDYKTNEKWRFSTCEKEDFLKLQSISQECKHKGFKSYVDSVSRRFEDGHYVNPSSLLEGAFSIPLGKSKFRYAIPSRINQQFQQDYEEIYLCEQLIETLKHFDQTLRRLAVQKKQLKEIQLELEEGCFPDEIMGCILDKERAHRGNRAREPYWWGW